MTTVREFDREFLVEYLGLPYACIWTRIIDQGRWETHSEGVFEHEGDHWLIKWSDGSTEMQDSAPWEYDNTVKATLVHEKEVMVKKWVPVEE